jgi:SAM-dependent methyltransferase
MKDRAELEKLFFSQVPKARRINPVFRKIFDLMYAAHLAAKPGTRLLNIYASWDLSGEREDFYRKFFFADCEYEALDYLKDAFVDARNSSKDRHRIPYPDNHFDLIVTTKYIMEHISEPQKVINEFYRVLKPGGEVFAIAPHIRRQHQKPWDYFRYTEYALEHLFVRPVLLIWNWSIPTDFWQPRAITLIFLRGGLGFRDGWRRGLIGSTPGSLSRSATRLIDWTTATDAI